ncbi:hypothetical protein BDZ94DRAFT_1179413 [Collybia nuda]|uniref:protein-tyrosine-phosphatase n=1 Tax=Collybia nuda TaxID=64659 RepID=A0A9P6C892_9AGAR|nr:hypothetical protein BDZ94DRAFT_1179413 [Collybia nuda]
MTPTPRRRGPPTFLRIQTPAQSPQIALALGDSSASALSSAASDSDSPPFISSTKSNLPKNMKKLSLTLPSAQSSTSSLQIASDPHSTTIVPPDPPARGERPRRPSIISLPSAANPTVTSLLHRKEEEGSPTIPYVDGPTQIIPGIWLGSEENARNWKGLIERGIKSVLNVAKEVASPLDSAVAQSLRAVASTPNFKQNWNSGSDSTYYPPNPATGRPGMNYLKLQWSHGQQDLVEAGFQAGMAFTDAALERGEGVLIHCQCGISRSATMVIALVMRAATERSLSVPPEVWALKGMQGAYSFVKEKSKWIGPNMSLIYQLLEYEKKLKGEISSLSPSEETSLVDEEEEWGRRRRMMEENQSDEDEKESSLVMREAEALDKAMEDRIIARKTSASSLASSSGSGVGMGAAWRTRYGVSRKRAGSIGSNMTNGSIISEDLVEEDEEGELLGVGGGFDDDRGRSLSAEPEDSSATNSPDDELDATPQRLNPFSPFHTQRPQTSFNIPPPSTAIRSTFPLPARPTPKGKRRPPPLGFLPPVPSSPISIVVESGQSLITSPKIPPSRTPTLSLPPVRTRTESRRLVPPPLHLRNSLLRKPTIPSTFPSGPSTPSQTLFVFPPSPTLTTRTPSTMTLTSNMSGPVPFPSLSTPRVSTFRSQGRTRSFIGLGAPPTPTTAFSKVDARGYIGLE